jgi:hypothetical protein
MGHNELGPVSRTLLNVDNVRLEVSEEQGTNEDPC